MNKELESLRMSVAAIAQAVDIEVPELQVLNKGVQEIDELTKQDRGWNKLCAAVIQEIFWRNEKIANINDALTELNKKLSKCAGNGI